MTAPDLEMQGLDRLCGLAKGAFVFTKTKEEHLEQFCVYTNESTF